MRFRLCYAFVAAAALLLAACQSTNNDDEMRVNKQETKPNLFQIGQGTFRVRHTVGGPVVAWAHRHTSTSNTYTELWITRNGHIAPGSVNRVAWILDLVTDGTDDAKNPGGIDIAGNPVKFSQWVQTYGEQTAPVPPGLPALAVPKAQLSELYTHNVTVTAVP